MPTDWTRTIAEIVGVWMDGCDVVFVTRAKARYRMLAEHMIATPKEVRDRVQSLLGKPVRLLHSGEHCEFIFELDPSYA